MSRAILIIGATLLAALAAVCVASDDADAVTVDEGTFYYYGDYPIFQHVYGQSENVSWTLEGSSDGGDTWTQYDTGSGATINADISGHDLVRVTQTVAGGDPDTAVRIAIPLHLNQDRSDEDGRYAVTFYDGTESLGTQFVTVNTVVGLGDPHVFVPANPFREGYIFGGWFTDRSCEEEYRFDATQPITGDTDVHAKWTSTGSTGGDTQVVVVTETVTHTVARTVTFEAVNGLRYDVTSVTGSSVSFTVSVVDGFVFDTSTLSVTTGSGQLVEPVNGLYTVAVRSNTVVSIVADELYTIEYRLNGISVTVGDYAELPVSTVGGTFDARYSAAAGYEDPVVSVFMDSVDITADCVFDGRIHIESVTADVVIVATADRAEPVPEFPWWIILLIALIAIILILLVAYRYHRKNRRLEEELEALTAGNAQEGASDGGPDAAVPAEGPEGVREGPAEDDGGPGSDDR